MLRKKKPGNFQSQKLYTVSFSNRLVQVACQNFHSDSMFSMFRVHYFSKSEHGP